jgi:hypothetical protein
MRIMTGALALGTALALCTAAASSKAEARKPPKGPVRVFVVTSDPYWIPDYMAGRRECRATLLRRLIKALSAMSAGRNSRGIKSERSKSVAKTRGTIPRARGVSEDSPRVVPVSHRLDRRSLSLARACLAAV